MDPCLRRDRRNMVWDTLLFVIPESSSELIRDLGRLGPGAVLTLRPG